MISFRQVFCNQITIKTISAGLCSFVAILMILAAGIFLFANSEASEAVSQVDENINFDINARVNNLSYVNTSNEVCSWECYPKSRACYTHENPAGSDHYDKFMLVAHTSMGDAVGEASCQDPGLCEPGNYDILHCYERGGTWGVPGDSWGNCTVTYIGYSQGYHYWRVSNDGYRTTVNYQRWIGEFKSPAVGYIDMEKTTTWTKSLDDPNYSLNGCKYYIYSTLENAQNRISPVDEIVINSSGYGKNPNGLRAEQTYYIRESNKPGEHGIGYKVNEEIASVKIKHDETVRIQWSNNSDLTYDEPVLSEFSLSLTKTDAQLLKPVVTEGSAQDLSGAHYKFEFRADQVLGDGSNANMNRTWIMATDENGQVSISDKYRDNKVEGDDFFEYNGKIVAPLGTYFIEEVEPPEGYLLSPHKYKAILSADDYAEAGFKTVFRDVDTGITMEQIIDPQTGINSVSILEQVIRGDYKFLKVNDEREILPGIPFKITSTTTGEWHIVVTDNNGIIDTSNNHYQHSKNTNCNDDLYDLDTGKILDEDALTSNCGTWFGMDKETGELVAAEDSLSALPYDTYIIEEIAISKNEKYLPFETRSFVLENNSYKVEGDTWVNKAPKPTPTSLPQTGDISYWIFGLPVLGVLCYITRRWVYCRKY